MKTPYYSVCDLQTALKRKTSDFDLTVTPVYFTTQQEFVVSEHRAYFGTFVGAAGNPTYRGNEVYEREDALFNKMGYFFQTFIGYEIQFSSGVVDSVEIDNGQLYIFMDGTKNAYARIANKPMNEDIIQNAVIEYTIPDDFGVPPYTQIQTNEKGEFVKPEIDPFIDYTEIRFRYINQVEFASYSNFEYPDQVRFDLPLVNQY